MSPRRRGSRVRRPTSSGPTVGPITIFLGLAALSCSTTYTKVVSTWRDPGYEGRAARKVLVVHPAPVAADQKSVEYAIAERLQKAGVQPSTAYDVVPRDRAADEGAMAAVAATQGDDLVLVTKLVSARTEQEIQPGMYGRGPSTRAVAAGSGDPAAYTPVYVNEAQATYFETKAYTPDRKLVWSGVTRTFDSSTMDTAVISAAEKIVATLVEQGLVAGK